jgi:hypothetical protein
MRSTAEGAGNITSPNSLVLYLDAANSRSYPGSGTTWYDISGKNNHFTLFATPTFTGKSINFNGTTQYGQCINTTFGNFGTGSFTVEQIYNVFSSQQYGSILTKRGSVANIGYSTLPGWTFNPGAGLFRIAPNGAGGFDLGSTIYTSTNVHMAHTIERNGNSITGSIYVNGDLASSIALATFGGNNSVDNALNAQLMKSYGENQFRSGSVYLVRAYNAVISSDDIYQNFTVLRSRFNL